MPLSVVEYSESLSALVERLSPSIVRVEGGRRRPVSGFVLAPNRVVTAAHGVLTDAPSVFVEGQELRATLKGRDVRTDVALLEVDGALPVLPLASAAPRVGQLALALARPGETVRATSGIVSAVGARPWRTAQGGQLDRYLEADAPHRPGFSGGPLVSADGTGFGMTSSALVPGASVTVPADSLSRIAAQLEAHGKVRQSWLGASLRPLQLPDDVRAATGEELGLLVLDVAKDGPAARAGLRYGDTVLHLGDASVRTLDDLYAYLRADHVDEVVPVKVFRHGSVETLQLTLGARA